MSASRSLRASSSGVATGAGARGSGGGGSVLAGGAAGRRRGRATRSASAASAIPPATNARSFHFELLAGPILIRVDDVTVLPPAEIAYRQEPAEGKAMFAR